MGCANLIFRGFFGLKLFFTLSMDLHQIGDEHIELTDKRMQSNISPHRWIKFFPRIAKRASLAVMT